MMRTDKIVGRGLAGRGRERCGGQVLQKWIGGTLASLTQSDEPGKLQIDESTSQQVTNFLQGVPTDANYVSP
jgi:hypothetical protein